MEEQEGEQICKPEETESQSQPKTEKEVGPEKEVEPEPEKEVEPESEKKVEPEPETQVKPELEKQAEPEPEKRVEPETQAEPEPDKWAEPEPETQAEPEPKTQAEPEPKTQAEPEPKTQVEPEPEKQAEPEPEERVEPEPEKKVEPEPETQAEPEPETQVEPEPEKWVEPETQVEPEPEKQAEAEQGLEKNVEPVMLSEPVQAEKIVETTLNQQPEKQPKQDIEKAEPETVKEEQQTEQALEATTAPVVTPGSLSFALLAEESTKSALQSSHTLLILMGLPGSGKSLLASNISGLYKELCTVISADEHGVKPESDTASADGHKALDAAVVACCTSGKAVVVVDDTNHTHGRLARLGQLAEEHRYFCLFLEPRTEWRRDVEKLAGKTQRGLDKSQIQNMKGSMEEVSLPLYFGWFLEYTFQDKLEVMAKDFLKTLGTLEAFKKHIRDFSGEGEEETNLEQYFQHKGPLHCTTKYCNYGKAKGAKEYAEKESVRQQYGSMTKLVIGALFITPRTMGVRVLLTQDQLQLWPDDTEEKADAGPEAELPPGSRAHITLGCAEGIKPVQTGPDLLEILQLQKQGQEGEKVQDLENGPLAYYGNGIWVLSFTEPLLAPALFSSYYKKKKEEDVKKKKQKCTIL
ncbi:hypothetical protein JZ751_012448 [Albula glossodonta]|uniref:2',3'-cyclic-nucleotide 3'-phosphodiesterase n=1 Tax=Albula glossodonta TaxID=121402 RepID=A0A8T2NSQ9_9TELE|nr:hypothetical protein JZ751_012448 [Albula glossodonta]